MSAASEDVGGPSVAGIESVRDILARFESAWQRGQRPAIEEYLPAEHGRRRALLIELVQSDLACRLRAGEAARVEVYLERYPELAADAGVVVGLITAEFDCRRIREPH